jgi:resuscitation-promoting factor RpfB
MSWLPPPPEPRARPRPIWKRWWFWAIVIVVILIAAGAGGYAQMQTEAADESSPSPVETVTPTPSPTSPSPSPEIAEVPNAVGKSSDAARSQLETAGFIVSIETKLTDSARAGTVLRQSEPPGSSIEIGDTITLTIAEPLPKIPNVVGKTLANAKRTLTNAGFEVGRVTQQTSSKRKGTVIAQSPERGTSARPGREVSLVTAKPAPEPAPTNCTAGYSPCLPPAPDYDCAGGSGDGPKYTGRVTVTGSDPYDLDSDNDGVGCE